MPDNPEPEVAPGVRARLIPAQIDMEERGLIL